MKWNSDEFDDTSATTLRATGPIRIMQDGVEVFLSPSELESLYKAHQEYLSESENP